MMEQITTASLFGGYYYGPADLKNIELGDGFMRLILRDSSGWPMTATYRGCAHWAITPDVIGKHFSIVQEITAETLTIQEYPHVLLCLQKSGSSPELLQKWESQGYHLYLHSTNERNVDYLVVAKELKVDA